MRLYKYINEQLDYTEDDIDEIISVIQKNCKPYLKDVKTKYGDNFLLSGRRKYQGFFNKKKIRKMRVPKDTPMEIHKFMDNWFYKKFGIKFRSNSLFCFFDEDLALSYGYVYIIFPIGKYNILSSTEVGDLYALLNAKFTSTLTWKHGEFKEDYKEQKLKEIEEFLENKANYKLNQLADIDNEVMLNCNEYYALFYHGIEDFEKFTNTLFGF